MITSRRQPPGVPELVRPQNPGPPERLRSRDHREGSAVRAAAEGETDPRRLPAPRDHVDHLRVPALIEDRIEVVDAENRADARKRADRLQETELDLARGVVRSGFVVILRQNSARFREDLVGLALREGRADEAFHLKPVGHRPGRSRRAQPENDRRSDAQAEPDSSHAISSDCRAGSVLCLNWNGENPSARGALGRRGQHGRELRCIGYGARRHAR